MGRMFWGILVIFVLEGFEKVNVGPVSATQRKNDVWIRNGRDVGGVKHQIFVARDVFT